MPLAIFARVDEIITALREDSQPQPPNLTSPRITTLQSLTSNSLFVHC